MTNIFNTPVLIKPMGLVVAPEMIRSFALTMKSTKKHVLADLASLEQQLTVTENNILTISAEFALPNNVVDIISGAEAFNEEQYEKAAVMVAVSKQATTVEQPTKRRRGRPAVVAETEEEDEDDYSEEDLIKSQIFETAYSFPFYEIEIASNVYPIYDAPPFVEMASKSEKNHDALHGRVAKYVRYQREIADLRSKLANPDASGVGSMSVMPSMTLDAGSVELDNTGLTRYENELRNKILLLENELRTIANFMATRVMNNRSEVEAVSEPFNRDVVMSLGVNGSNRVSMTEVFGALFTEMFVPFGPSQE